MGTTHSEAVGNELHISRVAVGAGTPTGSIIAGIIGQQYWDSVANKMFIAEQATNSDWVHTGIANDTLLELSDVDISTYIGKAGNILQVKADETGIEAGQSLRVTDNPTFAGLINPASFTMLTPNIIHKPATAVDSAIIMQDSAGVEKLKIQYDLSAPVINITSPVFLDIFTTSTGNAGRLGIQAGHELVIKGTDEVLLESINKDVEITSVLKSVDVNAAVSIFLSASVPNRITIGAVATPGIHLRVGTDPILLESQGANTFSVFTAKSSGLNGASYREFASIVTPIGNIVGNPGDRCTFVSGASSTLFIHEGAVANNTDWVNILSSSTLVVTKVGTPVDNQVAIWTGDGTIEGDSNFTFNGSNLFLNGNIILTPAGGINRNITFQNGFNAPAITLFDGGVGARWGWGLRGGEMQFFGEGTSATHHFSWNKGGDFQVSGTNEVMRLETLSGNLGIGIIPTAKLHVAGTGKFTGALDMTSQLINNVLNPVAAQDAATKNYVDTQGFGNVFKVGTPVDNQIGIWTGDGTIEGSTGLTFDGFLLSTIGNFDVSDSLTPTKAYRFRTSGAALDFEGGGAAMFFSVWSGANFTGAQHHYMQFNSDGSDILIKKNVNFQAKNILNINDANINNDLTVGGNLTVNGTTTIINSTTLQVDDKNIELGTVAVPTDITADGGGITLKGDTDKKIEWINATDLWTFNQGIEAPGFIGPAASSLQVLSFGTLTLSSGGTSEVRLDPANGIVSVNVSRIISVVDPVDAQDVATKNYVDTLSGIVTKVGTPVNDQVGIWTGDGTLEGSPNMTFDGSNLTVLGDLAIGTDALLVDGGTNQVKIGNIAAGLTDFTIFQNSINVNKGLTFSGTSVSGPASTTEGVTLQGGFIATGNNQLWVTNKADLGNAAKNSFRYIVGADVPLIVGVNNNGTANKSLAFGLNAIGAHCGFGFSTGVTQAQIQAQVHIQTGVASVIGLIVGQSAGQTADLFQVRNSGFTVTSVIDKDGKWGFGINAPQAVAHIKKSGPTIPGLIVEGAGASDVVQIRNSSSVVTSVIDNDDRWGIGKPLPLGKVHIQTDLISIPSLILQQIAGQTANLLEIRNSGGTVTSVITKDNFLGVGIPNPVIQGHIRSPAGDNITVFGIENSGLNPGSVSIHAGDREPNFSAGQSSVYYRKSGLTSASYENKVTLLGVNWKKRSLVGLNTFEIHNAAELDELATTGTITISTTTLIILKASIVTSNVFVLSGGASLHFSTNLNRSANIVYTGTGTFISGTGSVRCIGAAFIGVNNGSTFINLIDGSFSFDHAAIIDFDNLGTITGGLVLHQDVTYINALTGFNLINVDSVECIIVGYSGTDLPGSVFTIDTNVDHAVLTFTNAFASNVTTAGSLLDLNTNINNNAVITIRNSGAETKGNLFKQSILTDATINSVVDGTISNGTITSSVSNGSGGTTISCTTVYFENEEVIITSATASNGTYQIFNVVPGVSFDIIRTFTVSDTTGTVATIRLTMTLAAGHGMSIGDSMKAIDSNFYNGFYTALNLVTNTLTLNGKFIDTDTGKIQRVLSLDQTDSRVKAFLNFRASDSQSIAFCSENGNAIATTITDGTYVELAFSNIQINQVTEGFRLISGTKFKFEYIRKEPFNGVLTGAASFVKSGSTANYRIAMATNGVVPIFATAPYVPIEVKTTKVTQPLEFSAVLNQGDTIELFIAGDGTGDNITGTDVIGDVK